MATDDWYRNKKWNEEIEKEFFSRLKRARSQRDQYLVIQALTLAKHYPEASLRLVNFYFETRKKKFDDMRALLARAEALLELAEIDEAMVAYRAVLAREEAFPNHQSDTYVNYPYIVATHGIESEYDNALKILDQHAHRLAFPLDRFKWHAAKALIEKDAKHASQALAATKVKKSGFRFHQNLGLVGTEHAETIKELCKICT
ncbi:MAG: hypothetical protein OEN49_04980 [Gammaproteobacteria bacterium]|nr:hypothetical protein [Gammaproteobacteria bacterium]MDH3562735.1 hypothetical protein [Gammaproteobacteria bacterium]